MEANLKITSFKDCVLANHVVNERKHFRFLVIGLGDLPDRNRMIGKTWPINLTGQDNLAYIMNATIWFKNENECRAMHERIVVNDTISK